MSTFSCFIIVLIKTISIHQSHIIDRKKVTLQPRVSFWNQIVARNYTFGPEGIKSWSQSLSQVNGSQFSQALWKNSIKPFFQQLTPLLDSPNPVTTFQVASCYWEIIYSAVYRTAFGYSWSRPISGNSGPILLMGAKLNQSGSHSLIPQ